MKQHAVSLLLLANLSLATAAPETFNILAENETHNTLIIELETVAENFTGRTSKLSGNITYDPQVKTGSGTIVINGASIETGIAKRDEHMRSADWLNFDANPQVNFTTTRVRHLTGDRYQVTGNLTLNGVTKPIRADATVRHTPTNDATKALGAKGDVLAVVAKFKVKLSEFGVKNTSSNGGRVNDHAALTVKFLASNK